MKISKLFHWLYAILMLLPFAFFVPSLFYYAFNDNASMNSVEVSVTKTIPVNFNQYLKNDFDYKDSQGELTYNDGTYTFTYDYILSGTFYSQSVSSVDFIDFEVGNKYLLKYDVTGDFTFRTAGAGLFLDVNSSTNSYIYNCEYNEISRLFFGIYNANVGDSFTFRYLQLFNLTQMFGVGNEPTIQQFNLMFPLDYYDYTEYQPMQVTYDTGETMQLVENTSIVNYAWESIWDLPLFSWTKVTFVSVPFSYLTGIFGIGASNSLNYVFGYFVTISIVWLVFDLLLYVPMLAHNWIDKARIE